MEDQQFYKKLMSLMGNNKELKVKSMNGEQATIKILLDFTPFKQQSSQLNNIIDGNYQDFIDDIQEEQKFQPIPSIIKPLPSQISLNDNVQIQKQVEKKNNKKITLSKNKKKTVNEAVLNFIDQQHQQQQQQQTNDTVSFHSAPIIQANQIISPKTASQTLQFLKQTYPESKQRIEIVTQRMMHLEQIEKDKIRLDQQISSILSSSCSNSMRIDSSEYSMLSFHHQNASDPLCQIFYQYIHKNNNAKSAEETNLPSFLFLYSQPMLDEKWGQINEQINYFEEEHIIQKILKQGKCKINYIRERATIDKFHLWLKQGIEVLHFCGHGIQEKENIQKQSYKYSQFSQQQKQKQQILFRKQKQQKLVKQRKQKKQQKQQKQQKQYKQQKKQIKETKEKKSQQKYQTKQPSNQSTIKYLENIQLQNKQKDNNNYLLFESQTGLSVKMDAHKLSQILNEQIKTLKLVFVASCHSQYIGNIFKQAGALHIICVRNQHRILDQACQQFTKLFYLACINKKMKICQAFNFTKKQLQLIGKFSYHECAKFIMIRKHNDNMKQCFSLDCKEQGEFKDLTYKPYYHKNLPSRVEHFIPRPKDLHEILQLLENKHRFITIIGQTGIGKSTLVRQLVRYIQFRNIFDDGVIYIEIRNCDHVHKILEILNLELFQSNSFKLNKSIQQSIQKIINQLQNKKVIIVMDNCQNILLSDQRQQFKRMIENIMKNCDYVFFVFTHRNSLERQIDYCTEKLYELNKLSDQQARILFFQRIPRSINKGQLDDFFKVQSNICDVSKHPFFEFLNGHPQAICMTASLLTERKLSELYDLLLKPCLNISKQLELSEDYQYNQDLATTKVVETAMMISLNVLKNKHKDACQMIKILSMVPNGLDSQLMSKLFGNKWKQTVKKAIYYSLVQCLDKSGVKYYYIHPQIIIFIDNEISTEQKIKYHQRLCQEMLKKIQKIYRNIGTLSQHSQRAQELFLIEEDNYKAIILRQMSFFGEKIRLKKFYSRIFLQPLRDEDQEEQQQLIQSKKPLIDLKSNAVEIGKRKVYNEKIFLPAKKQPIIQIIVYYVTILFVVKKVLCSEKYIQYGIFIGRKKGKDILQANLLRIKGCILLMKNKLAEAKQYFQISWKLFASEGCGLGSASCQGAVGYIKFIQEQYAMAKMNMENALKYYDEIPHPFGKHYLNRWLGSLKAKMNRQEHQLLNHKQQAQKLLKETKSSLRSNNLNNTSLIKHKLGVFIFRFLFDNISLFLEASFETDIKPKRINPALIKKVEKIQQKILLLDSIQQNPIKNKTTFKKKIK